MSAGARRKIRDTLVVSSLAGFVTVLALSAALIRTYRSFPVDDKEYIMNRRDASVILLDRHNETFFVFEHARRKQIIPIEQIPTHVRAAVIAAEDKNFYHHFGFSPRGILRAAYHNLQTGRIVSGGSTITQQLVKNSYFSPQKSFRRKARELILAIKIERHYTKNDILAMYLNSAYFGEGVFGIEQAAHTYFNKRTPDLTLAEASVLASLLPAPSALSPLNHTDDHFDARRTYVLTQMVNAGFISEHEKEAASTAPINLRATPEPINQHAPHFALMVWDELAAKYGEEEVLRSGFKVRTTLDLDIQRHTEETLSEYVQALARTRASNGAAVILDPATGEIRALAGTADWNNEQFGKINMALAPRQPGSAFKPIVYATAFEQARLTPSSTLQDRPRTFGRDYRPRNYDGRFRGPVSARYALANSLNVPAVEVTDTVTPTAVVATARNLGISTMRDSAAHNLSLGLGSEAVSLLELTSAYGTFANNGWHNQPTTILAIEDKRNNIVYKHRPKPERALTPSTAFLISSILSDEAARRATFGNLLTLDLNRSAAVKTGTTQDYRDAWTVGYTPTMAVGVWIGNSNNDPMVNLPGALGAAPVWKQLMNHLLTGEPSLTFEPPPTIIARQVCRGSGLLAPTGSRAGYTEYFVRGTEPTRFCRLKPSPSPEAPPEPGTESDSDDTDEPDKETTITANKKERPVSPRETEEG